MLRILSFIPSTFSFWDHCSFALCCAVMELTEVCNHNNVWCIHPNEKLFFTKHFQHRKNHMCKNFSNIRNLFDMKHKIVSERSRQYFHIQILGGGPGENVGVQREWRGQNAKQTVREICFQIEKHIWDY